MKVLTYASYKEHCELRTEIHDVITVNSCQKDPARKLISDTAVMLYRAGSRKGVENRYIKFTLSAGTYSIDDLNRNIKAAVLQRTQDWKEPQIKDLKLVILEHYTFMVLIAFLLRLVYSITILKRLYVISLLYRLTHTKHPLIHHLVQNYFQ